MVQFNQLPQEQNLGGVIGQNLGQGLSQGLGHQLNEMFQIRSNEKAASNLAEQLNLPAEQRKSFIGTFGRLTPEQQIPALQKLAEARAMTSYFSNQQPMGFQPNMQQMGEPDTQQSPRTQQIGGVDFTEEELAPLRSEKPIPPIGALIEPSKEQRERFKENRKEILDYSKNFEDTAKLKGNIDRLKEAQKLVERIDPNIFRKALLSFAQGGKYADLLKTEDEQKLFSLLRPFLNTREIGGANPSTPEVLITLESLPGLTKKKGANKYILNQLLKDAERDFNKGRVIQNLRKINPNADPAQFKDLVERKVTSPSNVRLRLNGKLVEVPENKLKDALEMGAEFE